MEIVHTPVLLKECLEFLIPSGESYEKNPWMCDSTLGEGGHTNAFLEKFPELNVIGLDADSVIQEKAKLRLSKFNGRIHFYNTWFSDFYESYPEDLPKPDIILFDLGISVFHYEKSGRGFSFRYDENLDMRLNPSTEEHNASWIVNNYRVEELADLIYLYGEEKFSRRIASAIESAREGGKIE